MPIDCDPAAATPWPSWSAGTWPLGSVEMCRDRLELRLLPLRRRGGGMEESPELRWWGKNSTRSVKVGVRGEQPDQMRLLETPGRFKIVGAGLMRDMGEERELENLI